MSVTAATPANLINNDQLIGNVLFISNIFRINLNLNLNLNLINYDQPISNVLFISNIFRIRPARSLVGPSVFKITFVRIRSCLPS